MRGLKPGIFFLVLTSVGNYFFSLFGFSGLLLCLASNTRPLSLSRLVTISTYCITMRYNHFWTFFCKGLLQVTKACYIFGGRSLAIYFLCLNIYRNDTLDPHSASIFDSVKVNIFVTSYWIWTVTRWSHCPEQTLCTPNHLLSKHKLTKQRVFCRYPVLNGCITGWS